MKPIKYLINSLTIAATVLLAACQTIQTQQSSSMPSTPSSSPSSSSPSSSSSSSRNSSSSSSSQSSSQSGSSQSSQQSGGQSGQQSESDILNEALITFDLEKQKSSSQDTSGQSDSSSSSNTSQSGESGSPLDNTAALPGASESTVSAGQTGETSPWDSPAGDASGGQDSAAFETESGSEGWEDSAMGSESESYGQESADSGFFDSSSGAATGTEAAEYGPDSSPGGAGTDAERIIVLESRLGEQLAQFDGMILSERQAVIQQDNEEGSTPGISGTGYGEGEGDVETAPLLTSTIRSGNVNSGGGMMPSQPGDNRQGDFDNTQTTSSVIPPDIPDGSDDDVVARQLREAAMKETDPRLRERLWDEYRRYKQGGVGKP